MLERHLVIPLKFIYATLGNTILNPDTDAVYHRYLLQEYSIRTVGHHCGNKTRTADIVARNVAVNFRLSLSVLGYINTFRPPPILSLSVLRNLCRFEGV